MSIGVSFAGREVMRLPEELIEPFQQLCDSVGVVAHRQDGPEGELAIASPLLGRAVGLLAPPGDGIAAGIVGGLRDRLARAGALVREVPGDVCVAFRCRAQGPSGRPRIRVAHGLGGFGAHRRLAAMMAEHLAGGAGGGPVLSLSAGRWLGRWGGWQRPSALVEVPSGPHAPAFAEACVRGTYLALLRYFAALEPCAAAAPALTPAPVGLPAQSTPAPARKASAPIMPARVVRRTGSSGSPSRFLPPGEGPTRTTDMPLEAVPLSQPVRRSKG